MVDVTGDTLSCGRADVVLTVKDHPEAVVKYHQSANPYGPVDSLKATSPIGIATITGIAAGTTV